MRLPKLYKLIWWNTVFILLMVNRIQAQCSANFTHDTVRCSGENVKFSPNSKVTGTTYSWDFGDPSSGSANFDTAAEPTHVFAKGGNYTVTLIIKRGTTCRDSFSSKIKIYRRPDADFESSNHCVGLQSVHTNLSTEDTNDRIQQYRWDLGNATTATTQNVSVSYTNAQNYDVKLVVTSTFGCKDSITKTVTVYAKPSATINLKEICQNSTIRFTADTKTSALSYTFNFGDSSTFTQRVVDHIYGKSGWMKPQLKVTYPQTSCTVNLDSILVNPLPNATFSIQSDTQCFNGNKVCVKLFHGGGLTKRVVTFDDGYVDETTNPKDSVICHTYIDPDGGMYKLTVELTDTNGCSATEFKDTAVVIFPRLRAGISNNVVRGCFGANGLFFNTTNRDTTELRKVIWTWGDTSVNDTFPFSKAVHRYEQDGVFYAKIKVQDNNGCWDSATAIREIRNTHYPVDAKIDTLLGYCHNKNQLRFSQSTISGATITWQLPVLYYGFSGSYSYNYPGVYTPRVTISKNGCDSTRIFDSIVIHGPVARITNIVNQFQCQVLDTIYFENGTYAFRNENLSVRWDAQDPFGPKCEAPGKNNQNVWKNCNYSTDSLRFQHMYQPGKEDCYYAKLVVSDTALGCADSTQVALPLMAPVAKGNFTPSDTFACPGPNLPSQNKTLTFDINKPQPSCLKYAWWVMWDSLQASKTNNFDSLWVPNATGHNFDPYVAAGDSAGYVTVGLIVENGLDSTGKICRDTAWFPKIIKVTRVDARFTSTFNDSTHFCKNDTVHFALNDTMQNAGVRFIWYFGDGTVIDTVSQKPVWHQYKKAGSYWVQLVALHPDGCRMEEAMWVHIGTKMDFGISRNSICLGYDSIDIYPNTRYNGWAQTSALFNSKVRYQAGKERLLFDLGQGDGFTYYGENPKVGYKAPGIYQISMVAIDSTGCQDTLKNYIQIQASGVYADFSTISDTFLCPQSIVFTDRSSAYDSANGKILTGDYIQSYEYQFGSKYPKSLFPNPNRFFETGNYRVVQKVTNQRGCVDSFVKEIVVIGPKAFYEFLKDTVGCSPLKVDFKNRSEDANEYTWRFNDVNNNVLTTSSDSNVYLKYGGYGTFYPLLVARGSFTVNGVTRVCQSVYPDTSIGIKKEVFVKERPKARVVWSTDCETYTTTFYNVSTMATGKIDYFWCSYGDGNDFGEGFNPSVQTFDIINTYKDTGTYKYFARITGDNGCADTFLADIKIAPVPKVNFRWDPNCIGEATQFYDSTVAFNDYITSYFWDFNDGSFAFQRNPLKTYGTDKTYNVKLRVQNSAGCFKDTVKTITIFSRPSVSFWANPVCHEDTTKFQNSTISKQEVAYYDWDFNDGDTSQAWEPKHFYASPNNYLVKLRVKTVNQCWDSSSRWIFVDPNPSAIIQLTGDSTQCFTQHRFDLEDISTIVSGSTSAQWNFQDATTGFSKSQQKRYGDTGTFRVQLVSISNFGCRDTTYKTLRVLPSVVPDFSIDQAQQCYRGNQFTYTNNSNLTKGSYDFVWELGDGNTKTNTSPQLYRYTDTGILNVMLRTKTDLGCADTIIKPIQLWPMPKADFSVNDSDQCLSTNNLIFTNNSSIFWGSLTYAWNLGNGMVSSNTHTGVTYSDTGTYWVQLIASSQKQCEDTLNKKVHIRPMPVVRFAVNDSSQCLNQNNFVFKSLSTIPKGSLNYQWRLGDGTTNTLDSFNHIYKVDAEPRVVLIATSMYGCIDSLQKQVFVRPMPVVKIWVNDSQQCVNQQQFIFRDTSSIRYGSFNSYWRYKVDSLRLGNQLLVNFPRDTFYQVRLIAESDFGCIDSSAQRIQTWPKPFPNFTIKDSTLCLRNNRFEFNQIGKLKFGSMQHEWNFGDGSNKGSGATESHSYGAFGTFKVQLRSESDNGCWDTVSKPVVVWPMPKADFSMNDSTQCLRGNEVSFSTNASIPSGNLNYFWDFGDGIKDQGTSTTHVYGVFNNYQVSHWVISDNNCGDTLEKEVYIYPMPVAAFNINDTGQCLNQQSFYFEDISLIPNGTINRTWQFFDSTSSKTTVTRTFPEDIRYNVVLIQESGFGCLDTAIQYVTVFPKPQVDFTTSDSAQCLKQNFYRFTNTSTIKYGALDYRWDIGEFGEIYTTKDADYFYSFYGFKRPLLQVTSDLGCIDSLRKTLRVNPMPEAKLVINDSSQCFNTQNFLFWSRSNIDEGTLSHLWHMGDGNTYTLDSFNHSYAKDTFYDIKLIETSEHGCQDSSMAFVVARPSPEIEFRINDTLQCLRQNNFTTLNFTRIKYGTTTGSWDFGDGTTSTLDEPTHRYNQHGVYTIALRAISNHGCMDTQYQEVLVGAMPQMSYIVNDPGQCFQTQSFAFLNLSKIDSGTYQAQWHFGDDTVRVSNADQLYKYAAIGDYPVKLVGVSNYGCMDSTAQRISVNANPQVRIAINDSDQCINAQNFVFTSQSTIGRGNIKRYDWNLDEGDVNSYNTVQVSKRYPRSGFKTIRLVNVSDSGCTDSAKKVIRVYPKPTAIMAINDSAQCLNQNDYVFDDISTDSLGILRRWWQINQEKQGIQPQIGHVFQSPGVKKASLIVESIWGCFDTTNREVMVKPMPNALFERLQEFYCENTGSYPLNAFTAGGTFYSKNVPNQNYVPFILWRDTVTYVVTEHGCTDSSKQYTQVYPQPRVNLGADTLLCKNEILELPLQSWNSQYRWEDGSTRSARRITEAGTYWVIATNVCGVVSDTVRIDFRDNNCRVYLPTAFSPNGDALNDTYAPVVYDLDEMDYQIYNRWGQKVHEGVLGDSGWDGTYLGTKAPQGSYIIVVSYKYTTGNRGIRGHDKVVFHLLR